MSAAYDAIVVGAGHNGLTAAAYLASADLRVLVLERRERVGGAAVTEETFPGFRFDTGSHRIGSLHPALLRDLKRAGVAPEILHCDPTAFAPVLDGRPLLLWRDRNTTSEAIAAHSEKDAERWEPFSRLIVKAAGLLEAVYDRPPTDVLSKRPRDLWEILRLGRRARRLGSRDMMEVMRVLTMTAAELLDEWFETDVLKGVLGGVGISGMNQGPMAPGTGYMFLHHHVGLADGALRPLDRVQGGTGAMSEALRRFAESRGAEIRTGIEVERITVADGRATGVALANGDELRASRVISNADPRRTFLELVDPIALDPGFTRQVRNIRFRGACAKVNLALGELPRFSSGPEGKVHLRGAISISPSLDYLERAYDDAKYGALSQEPYLEVVIPTLTDPTLAPAGQHVMSILVQYAPYHLKEGSWTDGSGEELGDRVIKALARYAPNIEGAILHRQVLTPLDLESVFGLTEANIYHGEMTLDQLFFMRPVPGWARYRTPITGLYLCGAGTHPGGGVTGRPGYNAAHQILRDA